MNYRRAIDVVSAARGLAQQDIAARMGVDKSFLSRLGKGSGAPTMRTLEKVASALEIPLFLFVLLASDRDDLGVLGTAGNLGEVLLASLIGGGR